MKTITISKTYALKWQIKDHHNYVVSPCGKVFNSKTRKLLKRVCVGGSVGYCIEGKFHTLKTLGTMLEKITEFALPF